MPRDLMSEIVCQKGTYDVLEYLYQVADIVSLLKVEEFIAQKGLSEDIPSILTDAGLLGLSPNGIYISSLGKKVTLLLKGVNGTEDLSEIFRKLSYFYPELRTYELITEDITGFFINKLMQRTNFIRIYICSPWIRLEKDQLEKIKNAMSKARKIYRKIQLLIITLPIRRYNDLRAIDTVKELMQLGAEIVTHDKLHAKLYISEPGPSGGVHYAIFGSENLTSRKNIELGMKIENDNEILRKLTEYFVNIQSESTILKEVGYGC